MFEEIWKYFIWLIGGSEDYATLSVTQMIFRTVIIYGVALAMIRIGKRRFMGSYTAFDILIGFVVGSILSRAITGSIRFFDTMIVISTLILLHWIIAAISFHFDKVGGIIKNSARELIVDGEIKEDAMRKSKIGENDLLQALRDKAGVESPEQVKAAYLERDGNITVVPKPVKPQVIEIKVEEGVQTVKIVINS